MLNVYYGRESVNREKFIFDRVASLGRDAGVILLVPDQFKLQAERDAFRYLGVRGMMDTEVLSMSRLGFRVLEERGGLRRSFIDKYGRHMLLVKILREKESELEVFRGMGGKRSFVEMMNDTLSEFKQYDMTPETLADAAKSEMLEGTTLAAKLRDLSLVFGAYEEAIAGRYVDTEDYVDSYAEKIAGSEFVSSRKFWIYGFDYFSPKNLDVITALAEVAEVNVVLTYDEGCPDAELFAVTGKVMKKLSAAAEAAGTGYTKSRIPAEEYVSERPRALAEVERSLYASPCGTSEDCEGITLTAAANPYLEAESAAAYALSLIRDKGLAMSDILVLCNDTGLRSGIMKRVFGEYGIPLFADMKRDITHNPLTEYVSALMDVLIRNYRGEDVMRLVKTGFPGIGREDAETLENYVYKYKIRGSSMWKKLFSKGEFEYGADGMERLNEIRSAVAEYVEKFDEGFGGRRKAGERTRNFYGFLTGYARMPEKLEELAADLEKRGMREEAQETDQIWDILMDIFDQFVELMDDESLTREEYAEVLAAGLESVQVGVLPPAGDGVIMGTTQRTRAGKVRALIVTGANDGLLPRESVQDGLISDDEKAFLESGNINICKTGDARAEEERLAVYRAFSKPSEYLWVSCALSDTKGDEIRPAACFEKLKEIFPGITVRPDIANTGDAMDRIQAPLPALRHLGTALREETAGEWNELLDWYAGNDPESFRGLRDSMLYSNRSVKADGEIMRSAFSFRDDGSARLSPSSLEKYSRCPFSYMVSYGLRPQERRMFEADSRGLGDVYHEVLMIISRQLTQKGVEVSSESSRWNTVSPDELKAMTDEAFDSVIDKYKDGMILYGAGGEYRKERVREVIRAMMAKTVEHVSRGSIRTMDFEAEFGRAQGKPFGAVEIGTPAGKVIVEGKIDRIDVLEGDKVKIIDYKSGSDTFGTDAARAGWRLQLMLYLRAAEGGSASEPAGVFYFRIPSDDVDITELKRDDDKFDDAVSNERNKLYKLDGVVVNDAAIIGAIAGEFKGFSDILSIQNTKNGYIDRAKPTKLLTGEEFRKFESDVADKVEEICEKYMRGDFSASPAKFKKETACDWCDFRSICMFDTSVDGCDYRREGNK